MKIPTIKGVLDLCAMSAIGFGTLDANGFDISDGLKGIELCPQPFVSAAYAGDMVQLLEGIAVPSSAVLLSNYGVWKTAGNLIAGDSVVVWTDGVPGLVTLGTAPVVISGDGFLVRAGDTGVIYGASESGPWVLGR